ncbi:MAG: hypothetical protein H6767_08230 [Candidatus Peribacteria bacterium]|nr:MAG: hypothetical protein H6767_08230 [Candidatus Peribacteria bacterium]
MPQKHYQNGTLLRIIFLDELLSKVDVTVDGHLGHLGRLVRFLVDDELSQELEVVQTQHH